ncbi:uncharacterized protein N7506_000189 [Penicillium brevicompactum]|uniref:uncharacterized protein n=1 Tax=Penicillium brevicompactum TaxID=5074 RepID=UPI002540E28A|nr:uncharacterized protein N7506_000189 [Penicillium brevicompactum]KAJ5346936.1 hypothetical protein N7506_000189 [Penicillium brevicompactum]
MASTNHPSAILALIEFATKSAFKLIKVIQSRPSYSKPWRDLVKELESTKKVFASLGRLVTASTDIKFLRLASPLKECGTACNNFKESIVKAHAQSNEKDICGKNTPNSANSPSRLGHVETFRRHLSGYKSTFEVVLLASTIQTSLTKNKDLVNIKTLINCTIEDIDDLDNEAAGTDGLTPLTNGSVSVTPKITVLGDCRDICVSFRELVDQIEETIQRSITNTRAIPDQDTQKMADMLSQIHCQPTSNRLSAYFETLIDDSRRWNIETFIEGAHYLAKIIGPEKGEYYENALNGLHYPLAFAELWNQTYHQQRIDSLDFAVCPPGWSSGIQNCRLDLTYEGDKPLSQGLNKLLQGPTTMDCGMFCQLLQWMAIRYMIGDGLFDRLFQFQKGKFTISQQCYSPANLENQTGNLLFPFYDRPINDNIGIRKERDVYKM